MAATAVIGIAALVLSFLSGVLGQFPIPGMAAGSPGEAAAVEDFSPETVELTFNRLSFTQSGVIEELMSYLKNPDVERAKRRQEELAAYTSSQIGPFQELAGKLMGELIQWTALVPVEDQPPAE